jgi:hypothetical protein
MIDREISHHACNPKPPKRKRRAKTLTNKLMECSVIADAFENKCDGTPGFFISFLYFEK